MATGFRIDWPHDQSIDSNSTVRSGAKFQVDLNHSTTPQSLYSDRAVTTPRANPVVADSAGNFPVVYVATDDLLTLTLTTSAGAAIDSWEDQEPVPNVDDANLANYARLDGADFTGLANWAPEDSVASGTTINADALDSNYTLVTGTTTIANITLSDGAERLFIFEGICTLTNSSTLKLGGYDITTQAGMLLRFIGEAGGVTRLAGGITATGKALFENADMIVKLGDETTAITTGLAKITFRTASAIIIDSIPRASLATASTVGLPTFDVNAAGVSILGTDKLSINANQTTSTTATTQTTLLTTPTLIADDTQITIDCDVAGTNAAGATILIRAFRRAQ